MKLKFSKEQIQKYISFLCKVSDCSSVAILKFNLEEKFITTAIHDKRRTWIRIVELSSSEDEKLFDILENESNIDSFSICIFNIKNYIDTIRILQSFENSEHIIIDFHPYENFDIINLYELQTNKKSDYDDLIRSVSDYEILYTNSTKIVFKHADLKLLSMTCPYIKDSVITKYNKSVDRDKLKYSMKLDNISSICNLLKRQMTNCIDTAYITIIIDEITNKLIFKTSDSVVEYSIPLNDIVEIKMDSQEKTVYKFSFRPVENILAAIDSAKCISIKFTNNKFLNFEEDLNNLKVNDFLACATEI